MYHINLHRSIWHKEPHILYYTQSWCSDTRISANSQMYLCGAPKVYIKRTFCTIFSMAQESVFHFYICTHDTEDIMRYFLFYFVRIWTVQRDRSEFTCISKTRSRARKMMRPYSNRTSSNVKIKFLNNALFFLVNHV